MGAQWRVINENYKNLEGYKRVAWPPASEERIVREFTPQPQQSPAPGSGGYYPQATTVASANAAPAQAQFNRQPSREPAPAPSPAPAPASAPFTGNYAQYPQQQQQHYQPTYQQQQQQQQQPQQQQQQPILAVDNVGGGWKHIGAPLPKAHSDFTAGGVAPATAAYPSYQQQQHQQYPHQQQQQQYQAPSNGNYQQQQQPAPQHWQQQQHQQQQQQPPQAQVQQQYQAPYQTSPYQQPQQQQHPQNYPQQNGGANYAQPQNNSYSQPQQLQPQQQQLPYSQDQTDLQQHNYRGASPGIITLRKETPVSQKPAPVYTSQPAAVSYQGGSKLRGDLKWPPPEYKEAAVRENEERRLLALGPVCRPRRVNRDYTSFFAKNQLNCTYPSYKVPPGTQHMFG